MTRRFNAPIQVSCRNRQPTGFWWQGRHHKITEILETWVERGKWWEKAPEITVYHVLTDNQGLYELHHQATGQWLLYRVYD